jgi:hypothetical protein
MVGFQSFVVILAIWVGVVVLVLTLGLFAVIVGIRIVQAHRRGHLQPAPASGPGSSLLRACERLRSWS